MSCWWRSAVRSASRGWRRRTRARELAELDREQAAARQLLLDAYERCVTESMEALRECLGAALALDLIDADDFAWRPAGTPAAAARGTSPRQHDRGGGPRRMWSSDPADRARLTRRPAASARRWRASPPAPAADRATSRRRASAGGDARPAAGARARSAPSPRGGASAPCADAAAPRAAAARLRVPPPRSGRGGRRGRPRAPVPARRPAASTSARTASAGGSAKRSREGTTTAATPGSGADRAAAAARPRARARRLSCSAPTRRT